MKGTSRRLVRLLLALAVGAGVLAVAPIPAGAQATGCTPPPASDHADAGPFQVTTQSDSVNTFYSPAQLGSNGCARHPVILWGNGTFTTPVLYDGLLRHLASHGFVVAAANTSNAGSGQEMLQGLDTLTQWNSQSGNRFFEKVDLEHVGTTGHSQGGAGAVRTAADPRVDTLFPLAGTTTMTGVHGPTLILVGANDTLSSVVRSAYDSATTIPAAYAELAGAGHLTILGNAGGFRGPVTAWARWQLMEDTAAGSQFVGDSCGLCTSSTWAYETNAEFQATYGSGGGGGGGGGGSGEDCVQATNSAHVQAGRATSFLIFAFAAGSSDYLGFTWATTSLRQSATDTWGSVDTC